MLRSYLLSLALWGGALTGSLPAPVQAAVNYQIADLGATPGSTRSFATGINAFGQVSGVSSSATQRDAWVWNAGVLTPLARLPSAGPTYAAGINGNGDIAGYSILSTRQAPTLWRNGSPLDLGGLPGLNEGSAVDLNQAGSAVGGVFSLSGSNRAFLWQNGSMLDLGTLPGLTNSFASAINGLGQIAGRSWRSGAAERLFLWEQGSMRDLGVPPDSTFGFNAADINDSGQIVGYSNTGTQSKAFMWQNGVFTPLPDLTGRGAFAVAVNEGGTIVGAGRVPVPFGTDQHAMIWLDGAATDLNLWLPANSGWVLTTAFDVNDRGQIVGEGRFNGAARAFLLTPVPEPSAALLLALGLIFLLAARPRSFKPAVLPAFQSPVTRRWKNRPPFR